MGWDKIMAKGVMKSGENMRRIGVNSKGKGGGVEKSDDGKCGAELGEGMIKRGWSKGDEKSKEKLSGAMR